MSVINFKNEELEYDEQKGQNILNFLELSGYSVPYGCRDGYCGDCKCKLLEGVVTVSNDALAYCNDGEFLTCSSKPKGDITISLIVE